MKRRWNMALASILAMFAVVAGCAGSYNNMMVEDKGGMTVENLVNNWQNYNVYYAGTPGYPVAVLFDPKADGKTIKVSDRWVSVTDQATIDKYVKIIKMHGIGINIARLYKLLGENDSVFGYVYTTATRLSTNMADANTMLVDH